MLKPGDTFERYTIEALLGQGGMGSVYRAHDPRLGRRVALKIISAGAPAAATDARLIREARAAAALDHPNAVAVFDAGEHEGIPYIVMELVSGRTLRSVIRDAAEPQQTRVAWLADTARALSAAHRRGLVHRDIKPENVMVRDDGMTKVLDFGIARRAVGAADPHASTEGPALATLTLEGVRVGTPVYMAPEQIRGEPVDGRADQFAWGVLAYELLTGAVPWRGGADVFAAVASILTDAVDPAPLDAAGVPPAVRAVVLRALAKRPDDRFASMDDVVRALEAAAKGDPAPAGPATMEQRFTTQEVRDVLARAVEIQAAKRPDARLGFEDLLAVAEEAGVDPEALRDASRALRPRDDDRPAPPPRREADPGGAAAWIRRERRAFYRHLGVYLIVNAALLAIGGILNIAVWVLLGVIGWGIGIGIHGLVALTRNEDDWAEHEAAMQHWHEQRRRRHELALARAGGRGARRHEREAGARARIGALPATPAKVRLPEEPGDDAAAEAEAEAEAAENEGVKRKRR